MSEGFVYILRNESMPGYVKIGLTQQDDIQIRLRQLDNTSTPLPFECVYAARVPDCRRLEQTLHFVFGEKRTRLNREFFQTDPDLVKAIIQLVEIRPVEFSDSQQAISPEQRDAIEEVKARKEAITLDGLGLAPGTVLTFTKNPEVTCTVSGPRRVTFRGSEMSLSAAALKAVREMGFEWTSARGPEYWAFEGVKLSARSAGQPAS
ncbi:GIY-YIG nuclease family protein [Brevundimonas sp. NPDC092305]|uniref:GIY-YIG nuclease family protein n=1 Tax=Brevundimonas sp. NPDC092305 TaxID=3363957 RepID=UPI00380A9910